MSAAPLPDPPPGSRARRRARRTVRALSVGLLLGAALGAAEMAWRVHVDLSPSLARRALCLVLYAALLTAPPLGVLAALSSLLPQRWVRWWPRARWPALVGAALLVLSFAVALVDAGAREPAAQRPPAAAGAPNVLLVVVDTLRADALGAYGSQATSTPTLDALAAEGAVFEQVTAASSWTLPGMASLMTATLPPEHGCVDFDRSVEGQLTSLASAFAAAGYECRAVVGNPLLGVERGFASGFHVYDVHDHVPEKRLLVNRGLVAGLRALGLVGREERSLIPWFSARPPWIGTRLAHYAVDEDLNERVSRWGLPAAADGPQFLYVHYLAPHTPYLEHPFTLGKRWLPNRPENLAALRARYAGEVEYLDGVMADLLARLERSGWLADAIVCVTSDHGEEFLEHGAWEHGYNLHRPGVRVPWVLAGRAVPAGTRVSAPVSQLHLGPTLLELAGVAAQPGFRFPGLAPVLTGVAAVPSQAIFCEATSRFLTKDELHYGVVEGDRKLLRRRSRDGELISEQLYDLARDPDELAPLFAGPEAGGPGAAEARALAPELFRALDAYEEAARARLQGGELTPDVLEAMRALGYTGD